MIELSDNKITLEIKDISRDLAVKILSDTDDLPKETEFSLFRLLLAPDFKYVIDMRHYREYRILYSYDKKIMAKLVDECVRRYISSYHMALNYRRPYDRYYDWDSGPIYPNIEHISYMERLFLSSYDKRANEYERLNKASIFKNGTFQYNDDSKDNEMHHRHYGIPMRLIPGDVIDLYMDKIPAKTVTVRVEKIVEETYLIQSYDDEETIFSYDDKKLENIIRDDCNIVGHKTREYRTYHAAINKALDKKDVDKMKNVIMSESDKTEE